MTFLAPGRLWLLVLPLALVAAYAVAQQARRRYAVRFTNLDLLASVAPRRPGWRRHASAAGMLVALTLLVLGFARPAAEVKVPKEKATVMLAIDVSMSMAAEDVEPTRLAAAQAAARDFVADLPPKLQLGLVTFAGSAQVVVPPTTDRDAVVRAVDALTLAPSTAIGEAIYTSLDAIAAVAAEVAEENGDSLDEDGDPAAHIVVMSDGKTTVGRPNEQAAQAAVEAGVPVTTIAWGTDEGVVYVENRLVPVPVDREALRQIAEVANGRYFEAADADELRHVYEDIGRVVGYDTERQEVTAWFTGLALLAASLAAAGSLLWLGRLP